MTDFLAGQTLTALHFPASADDIETGSYTFTNTSYGVTTTGGTYVDLGAAFVAPTTGRVVVHFGGNLVNSSAGASTFICPVIREGSVVGSGTSFLAASDSAAFGLTGATAVVAGRSRIVEGLTVGASYNVRVEHRVTAGTGTALNRNVIVEPLT